MRHANNSRGILGRFVLLLVALTLCIVALSSAQTKYRTFLQDDLAQKKAKAGKILGSRVSFTFVNPRFGPVYGMHAIFSAPVLAIEDSGHFTKVTINKMVADLMGPGVNSGDSITFTAVFDTKKPGTQVNFWWWTDAAGVRRTNTGIKLQSTSDAQVFIQPNGGNVLLYIYKNLVIRPVGLTLGLPTDKDQGFGMIRDLAYTKSEFPQTGAPRCFDHIVASSGEMKPFIGVKKNLTAKKHNNHLEGELHALKLAVLANDGSVTEPTDPAESRLGDLLYSNPSDGSDPNNGLTIRQIALRSDSMLTFCGQYSPTAYVNQDQTLSMINQAFNGPYEAVSFEPFVLAGAQPITAVPFLHTTIGLPPVTVPRNQASVIDEMAAQFEVRQNYPNPFNPTTTLEFSLPEASLVTLKVYNMLGQEVATLYSNESLDEGEQSVEFNASALTSGIYFYKISAQGVGDQSSFYQQTRRMMLLK